MKADNIPIGTRLYVQFWDSVQIITIKSELQKIKGQRGMCVYADSWKWQISGNQHTTQGEHIEVDRTYTKSGLGNILNMFQVMYTPGGGWDVHLQRQMLAVILEQNGNLMI